MNLHYIQKLVPTSQRTQCVLIINTKLLIYCDGKVFLGAFPKLRKATISFVMSVCPCICPHRITRLPMDGFSSSLLFVYFRKSVIKIQVSLKSVKNYGCFTRRATYFFYRVSLSLSLSVSLSLLSSQNEKCFRHTLWRTLKHKFYVQFFSLQKSCPL